MNAWDIAEVAERRNDTPQSHRHLISMAMFLALFSKQDLTKHLALSFFLSTCIADICASK